VLSLTLATGRNIGDLAASIKDGRYREQKARMLHSADEDDNGAGDDDAGDDCDDDGGGGDGGGGGVSRARVPTRYLYIVETEQPLPWSTSQRIGGLPCATLLG